MGSGKHQTTEIKTHSTKRRAQSPPPYPSPSRGGERYALCPMLFANQFKGKGGEGSLNFKF